MRSICADIVDWMQVSVSVMKKIDYTQQKEDIKEVIQQLMSKIQDLRRIILWHKSEEILSEMDLTLQNMVLSLSWLTRDETVYRQIWSYQLPFFIWNLRCFMMQWQGENDIEEVKSIYKKFLGKNKDVLNENKLIICLHLSDDIQILEKNIACANYLRKTIPDTDLITIADSLETGGWLDKISNERKIQIFCPIKYSLPPFLCNGEYILDVPNGATCSDALAKIIPYMLQNNHDIYGDMQGIKLIRTMGYFALKYGDVK